jgi:hypothetical protein
MMIHFLYRSQESEPESDFRGFSRLQDATEDTEISLQTRSETSINSFSIAILGSSKNQLSRIDRKGCCNLTDNPRHSLPTTSDDSSPVNVSWIAWLPVLLPANSDRQFRQFQHF